MPLNKFFRFPFAVTGDKTPIGDATDPSGIVTYQQGYGPDYARDPATDPLAKNIERDKMNELFYDITTAIREYQIMGTPDFITSAQNGGTAFSYSKWARVRYDNGSGFKIYQSKIDSNTDLPTVTASWDEVSSGFNFASYLATQAQAEAGTDNTTYMSPLRVAQAVPSATESTSGRLQIATATQAQAYTSDSVALTPLKMKQAMQGSNISLSSNGYQKLPSGLIIQWGNFMASASGYTNLTFPLAFPNGLLSISGNSNINTPANYGVNFNISGATLTYVPAAMINVSAGYVAQQLKWIAIGY